MDGVVLLLPKTDDALGVAQGVKLVHSGAFVAEPAVQRLDVSVSPELSWWDEYRWVSRGQPPVRRWVDVVTQVRGIVLGWADAVCELPWVLFLWFSVASGR